jgi:diguanylate cyclase (GGDEF)-like protein
VVKWEGTDEQEGNGSGGAGQMSGDPGALAALRRWLATRIAPELLEEADRDPLTGLNNRRADWRKVDRVMRQRQTEPGRLDRLVRFRADVDNLKALNDTCEHQRGDRALVLIGRVLQSSVRIGEEVISPARIGGDEFAFTLVLPPDAPLDWIRDRLERNVTAALKREGLNQAGGVEVGLSMGFSEARPGMSLKDLDGEADQDTRRRKTRIGRSVGRTRPVSHWGFPLAPRIGGGGDGGALPF